MRVLTNGILIAVFFVATVGAQAPAPAPAPASGAGRQGGAGQGDGREGAPAPGAQRGGRGGRQGGPPPAGRPGAQFDLTGTWVSVVSEDWRWRMVTPAKGDYASVPLNAEGRRVADTWDLTKDNASGEQCRPFGAAGIMRLPTRARISWADDLTLKIETDAGTQTRLLHFGPAAATSGEPTWQGMSSASWAKQAQSRGLGFGGAPAQGPGVLKVVTTRMRPGYLRWNGVPYSDAAVVTEYYNRHSDFGIEWFTVTTVVDDAKYLTQPFITSSSFKKEPDDSKFAPASCETPAPRSGAAVGNQNP
jgi:hypothetical protein